MAFNPATDFVGLFRNLGGSVAKERMPSLDFVVAALGRSGLITVTTSATAPLANQPTTAWFKPANPSYTGEGVLYLWNPDTDVYEPATASLLYKMLLASSTSLGTSWYIAAGGAPANTVGNNGDFSIRSDFPGGLYGPKAGGAWPADPLPGSTYAIDSTALDVTFGEDPGNMLYRATVTWQSLAIGAVGRILTSSGNAPVWSALTAILDGLAGTANRGSLLYRGPAQWTYLNPSTSGYLLATQGAGADPTWVVPGAEFASGTVMVFRQTAAPVNWTKQTALNDVGLRVTSGTITNAGTVPFSTLFGTTAVGATSLSVNQLANHFHTVSPQAILGGTTGGGGVGGGGTFGLQGAQVTSSVGNSDPHTHSHDMRLAYADVIIATKN